MVKRISDQESEEESFIDEENFLDDEEMEKYFEQLELEGDEEEEDVPPPQRLWMRKLIGLSLSVFLLANVFAFLPQIFSLSAIEFLITSNRLSQDENIQQYKKAVVAIKSDDRKGTGFQIANEGLIVTNRHVVEGGKANIVSFPNGTSYVAQIVAIDPIVDLAILQIEENELSTLSLATDSLQAPSAAVYVIGNPLFFHSIVNEGDIVGTIQHHERAIMMLSAPIYKGNSGSPVINEDGLVIAVVFATTKASFDGKQSKVGLAIPIEYVHELLRETSP